MSSVKRSYGYSKMDKEDPEERNHRRAQFLIYKVMQQADSPQRRQSSLRVRICRLKIKIGKRFKRMKKTLLFSVSAARVGVYKQVMSQLMNWKRLLRSKEAMASLPPMFN
ncbi:hypothetical protein AQUCO_01200093v1 [Aquilegia coerulea]|uniref:Uncharacterized protein n=1 Tax=Aquilegia coerulea TaxID=218851 RepID=A0A2G5E4D1_AQUCA|nr:hypothetical protein AQUCO_01200093v1 [Aquilegia coerulea]